MQERENWRVADTTFLDRGLNFSLTSVCVGMGLAYCFMLILLVAKAFLLPDGDSCREEEHHLSKVVLMYTYYKEIQEKTLVIVETAG